MRNLYEFQEFEELLYESEKMKMIEAEFDKDGGIEITVEEERVVGKKFFFFDKKKKVNTVYRKSRGHEWHHISTGKGVSYEKRRQLDRWADELRERRDSKEEGTKSKTASTRNTVTVKDKKK